MHRVDALADLEPDDRRELALAQLDLDHRQQVVGLLLVALGDRVAGHPEELAGIDLHAREQTVEVVRHHLLQAHEAGAGADPQKRGTPLPSGTLTRASTGCGSSS